MRKLQNMISEVVIGARILTEKSNVYYSKSRVRDNRVNGALTSKICFYNAIPLYFKNICF